ncbi:MAG: YihY family inner membrane protein [Oligoflexia bacterium]|nr:YihY family inner membrane protein [Oligoflexia bacterium]
MNTAAIKQFWKKSQQDLIFTQATALAYTTLLSLVPVLAVAFFLFKAFGGFESLQAKLLPLIEQNLAPSFSDQISNYLTQFLTNVHAGAIGVFGIIGFIITSISTLATIEKTFNLIWGVKDARSLGKRITTYWSLLTIGPMLLAVSIGMSSKALVWLEDDSGAISQVLLWGAALTPYLISGLLFSGLFLFMPNVSVNKWDALKAGGITGLVFELAKLLYASYAANAIAKNSVYGSLAIFPIFLIWLYVVWLIVLFGAELCCYFQFRRHHIPYRFNLEDRLNPFVIVDILEELARTQEEPRGGLAINDMLRSMKIPMRELMPHVDFLEQGGWIIRSSVGFLNQWRFHLAVPKARVTMSKVLASLEGHRYVPRSEQGIAVHKKLKDLWAESKEK